MRASGTHPPLLPLELADTPRFEVLRRLGAGGFGVVYLVRDLEAGADVALKTLATANPELIYRLKREFRSLADIRHENLVAFHELFADDERCFFTMEYVPGMTLLEHVRPGGVLVEERLRGALSQLTRGLVTLHDAGILHGDLKPSNVLVTPSGRVVLLDFGLATPIASTSVGTSADLAGTPEYIAPEHAWGSSLSKASDWYSVGVVLYEALTGKLPFRGTWTELVTRQVPRARPLAQAAPRAPSDLASLCEALMEREPERRPEEDAIVWALARGAPARRRRLGRGEPWFVGRQRELARLGTLLRGVEAGRGATVLVEGISGAGKTALVQHFLAGAERNERALVLRGRCYERERVPYQGADTVVDELCRFLRNQAPATAEALLPERTAALARLFPVLGRVPAAGALCRRNDTAWDRQELRRQAFGALRELLGRLSERRLLVLFIDDLQWADADTAALLEDVLCRPAPPTVLVLLCHRAEERERSPCLRSLLGGALGDIDRVEVGPLTREESEALALRLLDEPGERAARLGARIATESEGNPFFIHEVARFVNAEGPSPGVEAIGLGAALKARIDGLPADRRRLLEVVAVAGHPLPERVARRAAQIADPPSEAWPQLELAHLVRFTGGATELREVEPLHDRIREAVASALTPEREVACHRGLASALEEVGTTDPEVLAGHYAGAGEPAKARILTEAAAARAEEAFAFDRAARLFRAALDLTPPDAAERTTLLARLARALANAGRGLDAAEAFLDAARTVPGNARVDLTGEAALQLLVSGRVDEGRELAGEALRGLGVSIPMTPRRALASLVARRALIRARGLGYRERPERDVPAATLRLLDHLWVLAKGLSMTDVIHGADFAARFLLLALRAGLPSRVADALWLEATHSAMASPWSRRTNALIVRMERIARAVDVPRAHGHALLLKGQVQYARDEWQDALPFLNEGERIFREQCANAVPEMWTARAFAGWSLFWVGEWDELARHIDAYLRDARARGNVLVANGVRTGPNVVAWLARGDVEGARANVADAATWSARGFQHPHYWLLVAETLVDLHARRGAAAWSRLEARWPALERSLLLRIHASRWPALVLRGGCALAAAHERSDGAARRQLLRHAGRAASALERLRAPSAVACARLIRAGMAAAEDRLDQAEAQLEFAVTALDRARVVPYAAAARRQLARLRREPLPEFLPGQRIADPDAITAMLAPGFPER